MMNAIRWNKKATKQLKKIPAKYQAAILHAVDGLAELERCPNVKALHNSEYDYRLRVGRYRVLFDHDCEIKIVSIQEVKKRNERTY